MKIQENIPLAPYTTFKIGGPARFFCSVQNEEGLVEAVSFAKKSSVPFLVLGGGSNVLISDRGFDGLVMKMEICGIKTGAQEQQSVEQGKTKLQSRLAHSPYGVILSAGAGEEWDGLVEYAVGHGLYGLENLSAIPGTAGAAPVQNIGAYGAEASRIIVSVRVLDTRDMCFVELSDVDCQFSYRDSLFKKERGRYIITRVDFGLTENGAVDISYKDLKDYFEGKRKSSPSVREVRDAVIDIRWNKLPDWKLWGTAGSFFKNPIVSANIFAILKNKYPELPGFPESDGRIKVPLGWILDKVCGVKGLKVGSARVFEKQALVLVTDPGGTAEDVVALAYRLMMMVKDKTGINIEGEVEWVN